MRRSHATHRARFGPVAVTASSPGAALGCLGFGLALHMLVGGLAFQICLWSVFAKDIPWYADAVAGFFVAPVAIPAAIACWVVRLCGVAAPFFG